ncbi:MULTISPECIES: hydrolase [unclassified Flavobacterium]|uniref:hydrolase n=1 Tax=unclassified Flavobacterium TaxID=196869 RepID=UPI001290FFF6|nr:MULTISPECIES: hydrolase [unclassified Flavobacterium]MQP53163.1 hydrolase [Flavobacterium sp. LMO9]MQP63006.1 hydrolase [Flavobacterium sp. LMO6]
MKNVIMYALIFSLLFNVFQYVNANKILEAKDNEVVKIKEHLKISRDSVSSLASANYFALESDEDAQEYFYSSNLDYQKVAIKVKEDLVALNENKNGNPLVPYEPIDGKAFLINTSKTLNHRWIIAEFSNGDLWGQILLKYFVTEGKPTQFETVETVLY